MTRIVIMGGGPAGYEAALVAAQHGADVTIVERDGLGGACVLYDCVPSKTLIATSDTLSKIGGWVGIVTAAAALYASFAGVTKFTHGRDLLPVGPR